MYENPVGHGSPAPASETHALMAARDARMRDGLIVSKISLLYLCQCHFTIALVANFCFKMVWVGP